MNTLPSLIRGTILGAFAADAAGATLEFLRHKPTPTDVSEAMQMVGGGIWQTAPGQITDDSELALSLLHALVEAKGFSIPVVALSYLRWLHSPPFDIGGTTSNGLGASPELGQTLYEAMWKASERHNQDSKANGGLMRITPLAALGSRLSAEELVEAVRQEQRLTHCNPVCQDSGAAYALAIRHLLLHPGDSEGAFAVAEDWLQKHGDDEVYEWIQLAASLEDVGYTPYIGFVKYAFVHAFRHLKQQTSYEDAIAETLLGGGDTDTNACIVGGMMGALHAEEAIPLHMREAVLQCDVSKGRVRPEWLQTSVVLEELLETFVEQLTS